MDNVVKILNNKIMKNLIINDIINNTVFSNKSIKVFISQYCSCCNDDYIENNNGIVLPCGHMFHDDCIKRPSFNYSNEKNPIYCASHKKDNMVDVKHERCIYENCNRC